MTEEMLAVLSEDPEEEQVEYGRFVACPVCSEIPEEDRAEYAPDCEVCGGDEEVWHPVSAWTLEELGDDMAESIERLYAVKRELDRRNADCVVAP